MDQLRLEQRACVHAHMDLLKIGLKLTPFVDSNLMVEILQMALKARRLDVEASPYDCSFYTGTEGVHVETPEGRKLYRKRQVELMEEAEPIRIRLLDAYDSFMRIAFDDELLSGSKSSSTSNKYVAPERHGKFVCSAIIITNVEMYYHDSQSHFFFTKTQLELPQVDCHGGKT